MDQDTLELPRCRACRSPLVERTVQPASAAAEEQVTYRCLRCGHTWIRRHPPGPPRE
jgi:hypothetical protein